MACELGKSCAYWIMWILKNLKWVKSLSISKFGLNKTCLTTSFNNIIFIKAPLVLIIYIFYPYFFCSNMVLLDTSQNHSSFHILLILCLSKFKVFLKFMNNLWHHYYTMNPNPLTSIWGCKSEQNLPCLNFISPLMKLQLHIHLYSK